MEQSYEMLIANLAGLLAGVQTDSNSVEQSLALICGGYHFDGGFVYEIDYSDNFRLTERFLIRETAVRDCLTLKENREEYHDFFNGKTVCAIVKGSGCTPCESDLLAFFSASFLIAAPMTDENSNINGLIVFFSENRTDPPTEEEMASLPALLSILTRYITVRMCRNKLARTQTSMENILDNSGIDIYVNDYYTHEILYTNKSMAAPYGGQEQFKGKTCWQVLFPGQTGPCGFCPQEKIVEDNGEPGKTYSWDYQRPFDGRWFRVFSTAFRWTDGRLAHLVSSADITDNKKKEALIQYLANYDSLTNLPNRRMLVNECEKRIDKATQKEMGYLLFFDIDDFKKINDTFGHDAGDEFLVELGKFFSSIPLLKDSIYRNGGDEFVAIIGGESITKENILNLTNFIHMRFKNPWTLKNGVVYSNTSIGVACYPEDGTTAEKLLHVADLAMYQAKKSGGGGVCFGYQLK